MQKWEKWLAVGVIVAVILLVTWSVYGMTTVEQGAAALADYMCEDAGGARDFSYSGSPQEGYEVEFECREGGYGTASFYCPMCIEV